MIETLSNFHFIRPLWLLLLPLVAGLWVLWRQHSDPLRGWRAQMDPELLAALVVGEGAGRGTASRWLLAGWLLASLAMAGPTWKLEPSPFAEDATPLMVVLKADVSMEQANPAPSPLERAHLKIADLASERVGLPLGLMAYAGSSHLVLPPTRDTAIVAEMASEISSEIMPVPGDRLDLALQEAIRVLSNAQQGGSILVMADAVDMEPAELKAVAKENDYRVQFLSLASPGSQGEASVRAVARVLGAAVETYDVEGNDIAAIVRRATSAPVAQKGEQSGQWQEAGYGLLPLLALMAMASFRREEKTEVAT